MNTITLITVELIALLIVTSWILKLVLDEPILRVGTKSVLFGAHCFLIHPVFVLIAWIRLYGFPVDPRIWIAFFVHDLGYLGKPNMDGKEGETHPELGARIMNIFDGWSIRINPKIIFENEDKLKEFILTNRTYITFATTLEDGTIEARFSLIANRKTKWHDFSLYHSRYYAKRNSAQYSKLSVADKLAFCIEPYWLYIFRATLTGEINEYMKVHHHRKDQTKKEWHEYVVDYMGKWVAEHKDMKPDSWTKIQENPKDWVEDFKLESGNYFNMCIICESQFSGHKYRRICKECSTWTLEKPKVETEPEPDLQPEDLGDDLCKYHCSANLEYPSFQNTCEGLKCPQAYDNYLSREK